MTIDMHLFGQRVSHKLKMKGLNENVKRTINNKTPPLYLYRDKKEQHEQNR